MVASVADMLARAESDTELSESEVDAVTDSES